MKTYTQLTREKRYQMFVLLTFGARQKHVAEVLRCTNPRSRASSSATAPMGATIHTGPSGGPNGGHE